MARQSTNASGAVCGAADKAERRREGDMGEIADMFIDGTLCEWCGVPVEDPPRAAGYPRLCKSCRREAAEDRKRKRKRELKPAP